MADSPNTSWVPIQPRRGAPAHLGEDLGDGVFAQPADDRVLLDANHERRAAARCARRRYPAA